MTHVPAGKGKSKRGEPAPKDSEEEIKNKVKKYAVKRIADLEKQIARLKVIQETGECDHPSTTQALNYGWTCDTCREWV